MLRGLTMPIINPLSRSSVSTGLLLCLFAISDSHASTIYPSPGPGLTLGDVTQSNGRVSGTTNPAAPALSYQLNPNVNRGGMIAVGAGVEYGSVDQIFDLIDDLSAQYKGENSGDIPEGGSPDNPGTGNPGNLPRSPTFDDILNDNPELEQWINDSGKQLALMATKLAVIAAEGYAKAFVTSNIPVLITSDLWGGSLIFSANMGVSSKALGIVDVPDFDKGVVRSQLELARQLTINDPRTRFDLTNSLAITIDPTNQHVDVEFNNDSTLLTKAAKVSQFSLGYSRQIQSIEQGKLFLGVKPKLYYVGLSQTDTRLGDLSDAKGLFDDIRNASFDYDQQLSIDFGLLWAKNNYIIGANLTDLFEPEFDFPGIDESRYTKSAIISRLRKEATYRIERQLRLEASVLTDSKNWSANFGLDANDTLDPMGDEYQWATVSGAYHTDNWWLPGVRLGYRENLAGTELKYVSAGITFLKYIDLDIATTLDTVELDGDELPRGFNASLGFQIAF